MTVMPFAETVELVWRIVTGQDAYGNDVFTELVILAPGAVFDPGSTTEILGGRDQVVQLPRFIWVDTVPTVHAVDAIRRPDTSEYEVTGTPLAFLNPYTGRRVLQVNVRAVSG